MIGNIYIEDWFGRSNTNYTFDENDRRDGLVQIENHKYSSFLYNEDKAERICSYPELMKREMIDMIHAIGLNNVAFNLSETCKTAKTDGRNIIVGIGDEYKNINNCYEKIDRIIGMTIHESCHCLYTDFNYIHNKIKDYPTLVHHIHNVIEDELIEQKLCLSYPGYENFLAKLKYNIFEKSAENADNIKDNTDANKILEILFYIIRYPKFISTIDENDLNKFENTFITIKKIMEKYNCFKTNNATPTISSIDAAIEIYQLIFGTLQKSSDDKSDNLNEKDESSNNAENSDESSDESSDENSDESSDENNESNNSLEEIPEDIPMEDESNCSSNSSSDNTKDNNDDSNESVENDLNNAKIIEILENIINEISSESEIIDDITQYHNDIENSVKNFVDFNWEIHENNINTSEIKTYTCEGVIKYNTYLHDVKPYIEQAKKFIIPNHKKTTFVTTQYHRNGSLDPTRLANAMCNEPNVYLHKEVKVSDMDPEYALVIMIDESGSMEDQGINMFASKIAIMLYEAMQNYSKIKLFVYGHGDCVYKYIDCKTLKNRFVLGNRRSQYGQDEIKSYSLIVEDVKKYTKLPIVMFNITDSCYCCNERKLASLVQDLRNDPVQKTFINLICLGHNRNTDKSVETWNDIIYGEGNWVLHSNVTFGNEWVNTMKKIANIIYKTVNIK